MILQPILVNNSSQFHDPWSSFYAQSRNQITLPVDLMTSSGLSQESLLRLFQGHIKDSAEENQIKEALKCGL